MHTLILSVSISLLAAATPWAVAQENGDAANRAPVNQPKSPDPGEATPVSPPTVSHDGFYYSDANSDGVRDWLRFYDDGTVIAAHVKSPLEETPAETAAKIATWFTKDSKQPMKGQYTIAQDRVKFSIRSPIGTTSDWEGTIGEKRLKLSVVNRESGRSKENVEFDLIIIKEGD
jgi:hypothetical protein